MLGAILGDIVGSVYEFNNTKNLHFRLFTPESNYTDDSIMTLAVALWAMDTQNLTHESLETTLVKFAKAFPTPMGGYGGGFSTWLFSPEALIEYGTGKHAKGRHPYNSFGNGSAMRVSAIGWLFPTLAETERVAALSASITHNHPEGIKGAQAVAAAVFLARIGLDKEGIKDYITRRFGYNLNISWQELHAYYGWESSCQGTVPPAIIAFLESTDFETAIRLAVAMGGDSDTLACITGAIAEAYYKDIPANMVKKAFSLLPTSLRKVFDLFNRGAYAAYYHRHIQSIAQEREFTPERITKLNSNEIFVFGSNLAGQHGGGAARLAYEKFGAQWGVGVGITGSCYAIPTMQGGVETIQPYVNEFIRFAAQHSAYKFYVTKIGCGIAGFKEEEIAPLFANALSVPNVILPESFFRILTRR